MHLESPVVPAQHFPADGLPKPVGKNPVEDFRERRALFGDGHNNGLNHRDTKSIEKNAGARCRSAKQFAAIKPVADFEPRPAFTPPRCTGNVRAVRPKRLLGIGWFINYSASPEMKRITFFLMLVACAHAAEPRRVVIVRDPPAVTEFDVDAGRVRAMVSKGIQALTGKTTDAAAWAEFAGQHDVVGIKVNVHAAPLDESHPALVEAIITGLHAAGVATNNIIVWDVYPDKLRAAGYPFKTQAVIQDTGWDANIFYDSKIVGRLIWGDLDFGKDVTGISERSHLPRLLTRTITKLINVPVLLDNDACGLSGCLYNLSLAAVDNARRFELVGHGDPAIAEICALPVIKNKLVLNIMDGLIGGYAGGPAFKPQYSWPAAELLFSRDPVAVDALCLDLLEKKRAAAQVPPIGELAAHITTAGKLGLGEADRAKIQSVEVAP